jgi:hypothetical protein
VHVKGGIVLRDIDFTIKRWWKIFLDNLTGRCYNNHED